MTLPIEERDVARAERVIAADVEVVYRTIEAVGQWASWVEGVVAPVATVDEQSFDVSRVVDGKMTTHRVVITARGPVHSLTAEIDHQFRMQFFTRPHPSGTHVEVVSEPLVRQGLLTRLANRRRAKRAGERLAGLLDRLAAYLERGR